MYSSSHTVLGTICELCEGPSAPLGRVMRGCWRFSYYPCLWEAEQKGHLSYCRGFPMKEECWLQAQYEKSPTKMKLYICSGSFHLKKKTNPSSLERLQGKDLAIVTRTHRLVWSNPIRKLEVFQMKKKLGIDVFSEIEFK